ncbi:hypothetical protein GPL15_19710 [Clostridium sp. MCC353]|uniref:Bug family tripartite tricarboxylate transporter substrate binding protein n=1 Tax=Clostridium sp. MCC353 TaxID=2592646 RepID=UPI001C01C572|nr:tripartite tricarboxylate transporter substrate binding protein [Clostridium sp. MCC353]MBT9778716.1 hypothetical protein [Clostridium sp. MCC353]
MKKLICLGLASAITILSLTGCGKAASGKADTGNASGSAETQTSKAAQADWPTDTVTLTVPASPGGGTDTMARIMADYFQRSTGSAFNVVNDTAGGNTVAVQNARRSKKDGSELLFFHTSTLMSYYQGKLDFNPAEELTVIASVGIQGNGALCVPADAPYNTGEEFIAYSKEHPGEIIAGCTMGGNSQAIIQCFANDTGIDIKLVDAGNEADWVTGMMSGTINAAILTPTTAQQYIEAGKFKALIVTSNEADETNWPGIQNMGELGGKSIWILKMYLFGPKDMDTAVIEEINKQLKAMSEDPDTSSKIIETMKTPYIWESHEDAAASYLELAEVAKEMSAALGFDVSGK